MEVKWMSVYENYDIGELVRLCRDRDDDAFDEIIRRYTPMMHKLVASFSSGGADSSELFSEACVALHFAVGRFDLEQTEVTFGLYARICIHNRLVDFIRTADKTPLVSELDIEQLSDEGSLEKQIADRETFERVLKSARELLSDYEYSVLLLHIQGYKTAAIAKALGRTAKSVDNAKNRLFRHLRTSLLGSEG